MNGISKYQYHALSSGLPRCPLGIVEKSQEKAGTPHNQPIHHHDLLVEYVFVVSKLAKTHGTLDLLSCPVGLPVGGVGSIAGANNGGTLPG